MKRKRLKKKPIVILGLIVVGICILFSNMCGKNIESAQSNFNEQLQEVHAESISIESTEITMQSETEGTATMTVIIPDYEALFAAALEEKNPDKYLLRALKRQDYPKQECIVIAVVTVEDGVEVIHTEEAVQSLIEEQLGIAIDNLMGE